MPQLPQGLPRLLRLAWRPRPPVEAGSVAEPTVSWRRRRRSSIRRGRGRPPSGVPGKAGWASGRGPGLGSGAKGPQPAPGRGVRDTEPQLWQVSIDRRDTAPGHLGTMLGSLGLARVPGRALRGGGARPAGAVRTGSWGGEEVIGVPGSITAEGLAVPSISQWGVSRRKGSPAVANGGGRAPRSLANGEGGTWNRAAPSSSPAWPVEG